MERKNNPGNEELLDSVKISSGGLKTFTPCGEKRSVLRLLIGWQKASGDELRGFVGCRDLLVDHAPSDLARQPAIVSEAEPITVCELCRLATYRKAMYGQPSPGLRCAVWQC